MKEVPILDEDWSTLLSLLPQEWEQMARTTGAMERTLRRFSSAEAILRTLLLHVARGYSLRETVVRAKASGLADVSDVALLKRLRCSEEWFHALCISLLKEANVQLPEVESLFRMRLVDGTVVSEQGKTGSQWRIHYSMSLPGFHCDHFEMTATKGAGTGESLQKIPVALNDCLIADRGFSRAKDIQHVHEHGAYLIVRVNTSSLVFYQDEQAQQPVSLPDLVQHAKQSGDIYSQLVYVRSEKPKQTIAGRLCVIRKSELAIAKTMKKLRRKASKEQRNIRSQTLEFGQYIIVFTTLPETHFSAFSVLDWYRIRWQIELVFKRFKSLAQLGHLPKYDARSSRAWLYGKLLICLLSEKLVRYASAISPWGYGIISKTS